MKYSQMVHKKAVTAQALVSEKKFLYTFMLYKGIQEFFFLRRVPVCNILVFEDFGFFELAAIHLYIWSHNTGNDALRIILQEMKSWVFQTFPQLKKKPVVTGGKLPLGTKFKRPLEMQNVIICFSCK